MSLDDAPLHVVLNNLAETYEVVAALEPLPVDSGGRVTGKPGSRVPPGVSEILDEDEHTRAVTAVDEWAEFVCHHLIDVEPGIGRVPGTTPGRLRLAARWSDRLEMSAPVTGYDATDDEMLRYAICWDAVEHLKALRRLARRSNRVVRTGSACLVLTCTGRYEAVIDGPDYDGDLVCDRCRDRVPHSQWSRWGARSEWVTVEHAARMLGISEDAVRQRASRGKWRKRGEGREVRYRTEDVVGQETMSA